MLSYGVLCCLMLSYVVLCCPMLSYVVLLYPKLPYFALSYPKLACIALRLEVEFLVGGGVVVLVQTNNCVKHTTKLGCLLLLGCVLTKNSVCRYEGTRSRDRQRGKGPYTP